MAEHPILTIDLDAVLAPATSVRVTSVGEFDPRHRRLARPLIIASDLRSVQDLRGCLVIDAASLAEEYAWMTPGTLDLNFLAAHELVATVTYLHPLFLRWTGWGCDAQLVNPATLIAWLVKRGWPAPDGPGV